MAMEHGATWTAVERNSLDVNNARPWSMPPLVLSTILVHRIQYRLWQKRTNPQDTLARAQTNTVYTNIFIVLLLSSNYKYGRSMTDHCYHQKRIVYRHTTCPHHNIRNPLAPFSKHEWTPPFSHKHQEESLAQCTTCLAFHTRQIPTTTPLLLLVTRW
jgi:hypothetical protein